MVQHRCKGDVVFPGVPQACRNSCWTAASWSRIRPKATRVLATQLAALCWTILVSKRRTRATGFRNDRRHRYAIALMTQLLDSIPEEDFRKSSASFVWALYRVHTNLSHPRHTNSLGRKNSLNLAEWKCGPPDTTRPTWLKPVGLLQTIPQHANQLSVSVRPSPVTTHSFARVRRPPRNLHAHASVEIYLRLVSINTSSHMGRIHHLPHTHRSYKREEQTAILIDFICCNR